MCGITGFIIQDKSIKQSEYNLLLTPMADCLKHRGPDSSGFWFEEESGVGLAHRRLAIIDVSSAGHQPMISESGRFVLTFNGEIYNHLDLRQELPHYNFKSTSDTETLLAGFEAWGFEKTIQKAVGMFAIGLWDKRDRTLLLARDRFGEKPLYYFSNTNIFVFASELKAIKANPLFTPEIDRDALSLFFRYNYIPAPSTIYKDVYKLMPGTWIKIDAYGQVNNGLAISEPKQYWSFENIVRQGLSNPFIGTDEEAIKLLETNLLRSVHQQMASDVPLGAFLSGGVDSSAIVALMQAQSSVPINTFTIGFNEKKYNEAEFASEISKHLGTRHTELYVNPDQIFDLIPRLPQIYDEPFADSSQIPTFLVSKMTREHVTVSLSGDAGDELFCGYNRYLMATSIWNKLQYVPPVLRSVISKGISSIPAAQWDSLNKVLPGRYRANQLGDKLHKVSGIVNARNFAKIYTDLVSHWKNPDQLVLGAAEPISLANSDKYLSSFRNPKEWMMFVDTQTYLPDDILVKVDRAAMANSLETRVPFLDHRIVELAWKLPFSMKLRDGQSKWILRQILYKYVPKKMIERPKMGFGIPLEEWLRGPLRDWAESLLNTKRLRNEGFLNAEMVAQKWKEHLSGKRNWQYYLWDVLMFQAWYEFNRS